MDGLDGTAGIEWRGERACERADPGDPGDPGDPQAFYKRYLIALEKAAKIEDLLPLLAPRIRDEIGKMPKAERATVFEVIKEFRGSAENMAFVNEERTATGITLTVRATQGKSQGTGTIQLVREDDAWKLERDAWSWKN